MGAVGAGLAVHQGYVVERGQRPTSKSLEGKKGLNKHGTACEYM